MKKYLLMMVVLVMGVTANVSYAQTTQAKKTPQEEQKEIKAKFDKLGKDIDAKLAVAQDNLNKATADTKEEMQKAVDKLKKESAEAKRGADKAAKEAKEDWQTVKKELNDLANRIEQDLKK